MSIETAIAWAKKKIRLPRYADEAVELFEQAAREVTRATVLLSGTLTRDRKGWAGRWTGHEFVATELSPSHQKGLGIVPGAMCRQQEDFVDGRLPHQQCVTLSSVAMDAARISSSEPLLGRCIVRIDDVSKLPLRNLFLRAEHYRPDLRRPVAHYWHLDEALRPGGHELHFKFLPLESEKNPGKVVGTQLVYLQLLTADRVLSPMTGIREISNTTVVPIELTR